MALSPDKARPPTLKQLADLGASEIDIRGVSFSPAPGNRGPQRGAKVVSWQATISSVDASRPSIRAIRDDPDEADHAARGLFMQMMAKKAGEFTATVSTPADWTAAAKTAPKAKPRQAVAPAPDDEVDDMI